MLLLTLTGCDPQKRQQMMVSSPNVAIRALFAVNPADGTVDYTVFWGHDTIVYTSPMGVLLSNGDSLDSGFELINFTQQRIDSTWTVPADGRRIRDHYSGILINLRRRTDGQPMTVHARMFDGYMAIRYEIPTHDSIRIDSVLTGFNAYSRIKNDHSIYLPERRVWIKTGRMASFPTGDRSYSDWKLIYVSNHRDRLESTDIVLNFEKH